MVSEIIFDHDAAGIIKGRFLAIKWTVASTSALYFACRMSMTSILSSKRDMSSNPTLGFGRQEYTGRPMCRASHNRENFLSQFYLASMGVVIANFDELCTQPGMYWLQINQM